MPDSALVKNGVIVAIARHPVTPASFGPDPDGEAIEFPSGLAFAGMLWDGETLSNPPPPEPEPPGVPASVSMRQARLVLLGAGLLDEVEALMSSQPQAVQIEWEYATDIHRNRDLTLTLGSALGLSDGQIDALFVAAVAIR